MFGRDIIYKDIVKDIEKLQDKIQKLDNCFVEVPVYKWVVKFKLCFPCMGSYFDTHIFTELFDTEKEADVFAKGVHEKKNQLISIEKRLCYKKELNPTVRIAGENK